MKEEDKALYLARRQTLLKKFPDSIILIPAASPAVRTHDTDYPFRQQSNFYYLCGLEEPDALLVLCSHPSLPSSTLFVRPKDSLKEQWDGPRLGEKKAPSKLGIGQAFSIAKLEEELPKLFLGHRHLVLDLYHQGPLLEKALGICRQLLTSTRRKVLLPHSCLDLIPIIGEMRAIKDKKELALIRHGLTITQKAHLAAMAFSAPGKKENEVQALMEYIFKKEGGAGPAYGSIVASANNANILHYQESCATLRDGDLLLIDAGVEFDMYATDITRTFPINNTFSGPQRDIYQLVLAAQKETLKICRPGIGFKEFHEAALKTLAEGLVELKILSGKASEHLEKVAAVKNKKLPRSDCPLLSYYPHGTGHWLGMDVHDPNPYMDSQAQDISFQEGMVITCEPGLYFPLANTKVPDAFRGIGVRIEDDILISSIGCEVLSCGIPKEISQVEAACRQDYQSFLS